MSEFKCPVVRVGKIVELQNSDTLAITTVEGCPCIIKRGSFQKGDLAIYVPVDAVVPATVPGTEFLKDKRRIRAVKLRGIFSMGLLLPTTCLPEQPVTGVGVSGYQPGKCCASLLGITKWEEPEITTMQDDQAPAPKLNVPVYDVESWRKYGPFEGNPIVEVTEKIHGTNSRAVWWEGELHVGSHRTWKKESETNLWWKMAHKYGLKEKLGHPRFEAMVFYYETFGQVQDLTYGIKGAEIRVFDIFNVNTGEWLDTKAVHSICGELDLPYVPLMFVGPQDGIVYALEGMSKGKSMLADNIREGVVIKTVDPGYDIRYGRTILKLVGEDYLLRRGGTERH